MKVNLDPITESSGNDNMGGFKDVIGFVPASSVSEVPTLPVITDASLDADFVTAAGEFVFKTNGETPKVIVCTEATVKFASANQGEIEGQSFAQSGEFFKAGSSVEVAAFARQVNNVPGYLILEDMSGKQIIVGQKGLPCHIKPDYDGGQKRVDRRGSKFTFACDSVAPIIYIASANKIDLDAILNPES